MDSTPNVAKKTIFTAEQEEYLKNLQSEGLTGTGKKFQSVLERAVLDTGLPMQAICNKVHNMRRGARALQDTVAPARKHMQARKISAYNHFCHLVGSKSNDKIIRQKIWATMWAKLTKQQKQWYYDEAEKLNNTPLSELEGERREAAVKMAKDAIMYHMRRLQKLQPFHGFVILTDKETVWSSSCGSGNVVLEEQEVQLQAALSNVAENETQPSSKKKQRENLRKAAEAKLRELYGMFCNEEGECPFPYKDYIEGNADFAVVGLPEGFVLNKPSDMGKKRIQIVLDSDLSIVAIEKENVEPTNLDTPSVDGSVQPLAADHEGLTQHDEMESSSFGHLVDEQPISEDFPQMDSITYEISVNEDSVTVMPQSVSPHEDSVEGDITTVPHPSAEEAMSTVQAMAQALEKRNSKGLRYEKDNKGKIVLRSLLGKTIFQLWTVINPGRPNSKQWYKGTVVEVKANKFAIHFTEDDVFEPLSPGKATTGFSKGTLLLLD